MLSVAPTEPVAPLLALLPSGPVPWGALLVAAALPVVVWVVHVAMTTHATISVWQRRYGDEVGRLSSQWPALLARSVFASERRALGDVHRMVDWLYLAGLPRHEAVRRGFLMVTAPQVLGVGREWTRRGRAERDAWVAALCGPERTGEPVLAVEALLANRRAARAWVRRLGADRALLAVHAGMFPEEAARLAESGALDPDSLRALAALRDLDAPTGAGLPLALAGATG